MKIRPLHDRILVKRLEGRTHVCRRHHYSRHGSRKAHPGQVIAVGNGKILEDGSVRKLDVKIGDKVLFGKYGGTEVKVDGEELLVMREDDIMAVIEGK